MRDTLSRIRARSPKEKTRIALLASFVITSLVATGWIGALVSSKPFSSEVTAIDTVREDSEVNTLLGGVSEAFDSAFGNIPTDPTLTVVETEVRGDGVEQKVDDRTVIPF